MIAVHTSRWAQLGVRDVKFRDLEVVTRSDHEANLPGERVVDASKQ